MLISVLANTLYNIYNSGRPKSSTRNFDEQDVLQVSKIATGNVLRMRYYESLKTGGPDSYFVAPLLSIQDFKLGKEDSRGMRRADMSQFDLYRMPHDNHITNVYPKGCKESASKSIPLFAAGEEYFFSGPKFSSLQFGVVKGRGINAYHLPTCVESLVVEATFDGKNDDGTDIDVDISFDICYDVSNEVLARLIGIPDLMNKNTDNPYALPIKNLKQRLAPQPE